MSVRRKLFVAFASFIVGMGLIFIFLTLTVVWGILHVMLDIDREEKIEQLTGYLLDYYQGNGHSWNRIGQFALPPSDETVYPGEEILLMSSDGRILYKSGDHHMELIRRFGIHSVIESDGNTAVHLYYYDREIGNMGKMRIGVTSSVTTLLILAALILMTIALFAAYRLARKITAPLSGLMAVIDRFGKGEYGVQIPVVSRDEYGKVAEAFNSMSRQIYNAEEARRKLTEDVAHELRTPITIIRGKLELMQQQNRPIDPQNLLPLQDEFIRLSRLVEDLHQLTLAEARKLPMKPQMTDMAELLKKVVETVRSDAEPKQIDVALKSDSPFVHVRVDPDRMTQVFYNLLVNAVRYTPSGGRIDVTVKRVERMESASFVQVDIVDNGIGIEPEHLPFLFDRFYRTDKARARNSGGTGLGLAIAREFVAAHEGTIEVESKPRQGTTFTIRLPV